MPLKANPTRAPEVASIQMHARPEAIIHPSEAMPSALHVAFEIGCRPGPAVHV